MTDEPQENHIFYGNDRFWCRISEELNEKDPVDLYTTMFDGSIYKFGVVAHKYFAMEIIDYFIKKTSGENDST